MREIDGLFKLLKLTIILFTWWQHKHKHSGLSQAGMNLMFLRPDFIVLPSVGVVSGCDGT